MSRIKISDWQREDPHSAVVATFTLTLPSGLVIHGVQLLTGKAGRRYVELPDGVDWSNNRSRHHYQQLILEEIHRLENQP